MADVTGRNEYHANTLPEVVWRKDCCYNSNVKLGWQEKERQGDIRQWQCFRGEEVVGAKVLFGHWTSRTVADETLLKADDRGEEIDGASGLLMGCRVDARHGS